MTLCGAMVQSPNRNQERRGERRGERGGRGGIVSEGWRESEVEG